MGPKVGAEPLLSDPKRLLLDLAQAHSVSELLQLIVNRLSASDRVALARIWLAQSTASCSRCPMAEVCRTQTKCLQRVASGGRSRACSSSRCAKTQGAFRRLPFGAGTR